MTRTTLTSLLVPALVSSAFVGTIVVAAVAPAAAQRDYRDQTDRAIRRCEDELQFRMRRDVGGRSAEATVDYRRADVRQRGRDEYEIDGPGFYSSGNNDRGRPFTYRCVVDMNNGRVDARYDWSRGDDNRSYDRPGSSLPYPPSDRPGYGGGQGQGPQGRSWYIGGIISRSSNKALDVQNRSMQNDAPIQQWDYAGAANQKWDIIDVGRDEHVILSQSSNKVLEIADGSGADGAALVQNRWRNNANQRWRFERTNNGSYQIINVNTGKCLDVKDRSMENGAAIQQWSCASTPNQMWRLIDAGRDRDR
jgi:hypothetical protein